MDVLAEDSRNVQRLVASGEVDFGVSSLHSPDANLALAPLIEDRFGLLCPGDHPLANTARPVTWEALKGHPIIGNVMHRLLAETRPGDIVAHPHIQVSNLPTLVALVENGLGVTPLPALACPRNLRGLAFVPLVKPVKTRVIGVMTREGRTLLPAAQVFVEMMRAQVRRERV